MKKSRLMVFISKNIKKFNMLYSFKNHCSQIKIIVARLGEENKPKDHKTFHLPYTIVAG